MARQKPQQFTNIQDPPVSDPARADYTPPEAKARRNGGGEAPNGQPPGKDRVYGVASRDRWPGSDSAALRQQHKESRALAGDEGGEEEEEEEAESEERTSADLTVAELKAALDAQDPPIEYPAGAKKPQLVALYDEHVAE